jgi:hypothetical protein
LGSGRDVEELLEAGLSEADAVRVAVLAHFEGGGAGEARSCEGVCYAGCCEGAPGVDAAFEVAVLEDFVGVWGTGWCCLGCGCSCR